MTTQQLAIVEALAQLLARDYQRQHTCKSSPVCNSSEGTVVANKPETRAEAGAQ